MGLQLNLMICWGCLVTVFSMYMQATAGLRALGMDASDRILQAVSPYLIVYILLVFSCFVTILRAYSLLNSMSEG